jgi:hypothetical protein
MNKGETVEMQENARERVCKSNVIHVNEHVTRVGAYKLKTMWGDEQNVAG